MVLGLVKNSKHFVKEETPPTWGATSHNVLCAVALAATVAATAAVALMAIQSAIVFPSLIANSAPGGVVNRQAIDAATSHLRKSMICAFLTHELFHVTSLFARMIEVALNSSDKIGVPNWENFGRKGPFIARFIVPLWNK